MDLSTKKKPLLIGAIHLPPFSYGMTPEKIQEIERYAIENARIYEEGGFSGVFIQDQSVYRANYFTTAMLALITRSVYNNVKTIAVGTQMESDTAEGVLTAAATSGASFVRLKVFVGAMVKQNGIIHGCGWEAREYKDTLKRDIQIFADIYDRTGFPVGDFPIEKAALQALNVGANALVITGKNYEQTLEYLQIIRKAAPEAILLCGGSVTEKNIQEVLIYANGAIVSSALKSDHDQNNWDVNKIKSFVKAATT